MDLYVLAEMSAIKLFLAIMYKLRGKKRLKMKKNGLKFSIEKCNYL